ncbi:MAG: OmpA family protein, partial [Rhodobacteraceae bacterium]|nr:OmpA family protein [Paracoccaceae bacterium]
SQLSLEVDANLESQSTIEGLNKEIQSLRNDVAAQLQTIEVLQGSRLQLEAQLAELKSELSLEADAHLETQSTIQGLSKGVQTLRDELAARLQTIEVLQGSKAQLEAQLAELKSELSLEADANLETQSTIQGLSKGVQTLRDELAALNATLERQKSDIEERDAKIVNLGEDLNAALAERAATELRLRMELESEAAKLRKFRSRFLEELRHLVEGHEGVRIVDDRFVFSSEVLFNPGEANLSEEGRHEITEVAERILRIGQEFPDNAEWVLGVAGHTDDRQLLPGAEFADNWELSQARALSVVKYLTEVVGFPAERLAATAFSEYQPVESNKSQAGRSRNRRIEFKLTLP